MADKNRFYAEEDVHDIIREAEDSATAYEWGVHKRVRLEDYPVYDFGWHTGTPTEEGLYVVLTKVATIGVHSSEGTYILDWWDGYCFKNLKAIVQNSPIHRNDEYSWVKWQKIEETD